MLISVVTSLYKSEKYVRDLYKRLSAVLEKIGHDYELIFVNDGYEDNALEISINLSKNDSRLTVINLSRNFGQHAALTAGLSYARGDLIVVMDSDLQDVPEEIIKLYSKVQEGYDAVWSKRVNRKDSSIKRCLSFLFYRILSYLTDIKWDHTIANFGIFNKKTINTFLNMREQNRYFPMMMRWIGFKQTSIDVVHDVRAHDTSSYSIRKLVKVALDATIYFSQKPLKIFAFIGFLVSFLSFIYALEIFFSYMCYGRSVLGWSSIMVSLWFLSGIIIFIIGVCGIYIGNTFNETKRRPNYIIDNIYNKGK